MKIVYKKSRVSIPKDLYKRGSDIIRHFKAKKNSSLNVNGRVSGI